VKEIDHSATATHQKMYREAERPLNSDCEVPLLQDSKKLPL
jgi:hypothetical protein